MFSGRWKHERAIKLSYLFWKTLWCSVLRMWSWRGLLWLLAWYLEDHLDMFILQKCFVVSLLIDPFRRFFVFFRSICNLRKRTTSKWFLKPKEWVKIMRQSTIIKLKMTKIPPQKIFNLKVTLSEFT